MHFPVWLYHMPLGCCCAAVGMGAAEDGGLAALAAPAGSASWMRQAGKAQAAPKRRRSEYEWAVR
jgi:hypothetical protein